MGRQVPYNYPPVANFAAVTTPALTTRTMNQRFDQIVRIGVQLGGTPFASQANLATKSYWTALLAASDATQIILSPLFSGSKITPSKPLQTGPDTNNTYLGEPVYFGEGTAEFSADFTDCDASAIDTFFAIVSQFSMSGTGLNPATKLVAYLCNKDGMIFSTPAWGGLPCINLSPRTRMSDGLNSSDKTGFSFFLPPNWDGGLTLPTPTVPSNPAYALTSSTWVDLRTYP